MAILSINQGITGLSGVKPAMWFINTTNTTAEATTAGFLTKAYLEGLASFSNADVAAVTVINAGVSTSAWYNISVTGTPGNFVYSLVAI